VNATWGVTSLLLGGVIQPVDYVFHWWTWWVGDAIGVITFTPLILIWAAKPAVFSHGRQISLALCLTFALVVTFFIYTNTWEQDRIELEFKRRTDQLAQQLQEKFHNYIDVLHSVANLYASSVPINRQQFKTFVSRWFSLHPGIRAVSWTPRILDSERANYEQAAREDGLSNFQVAEQSPDGPLIRAAQRAEYIPVYYVESVTGSRRTLGFDAASDPTRREALNRARDTGKPTATDPLRLLQDSERRGGFVVFLPVYKPGRPQNSLEERRLNLHGYVSGVFRIDEMMNNALKDAKTDDIEIRLFDARDGEKKRLLYEHRLGEVKSHPVEANQSIQPAPLQRVVPFQIAGHHWIVQFTPTKEYLIAQRGWQAWSVLAGGLFFTGLLGGFLLVLTGHTTKLRTINTDLEKEITERRRAEDAVTQLAAIVESSDDAIIGTTLDGVITSWNKGAENLYDYSAEEVTGRPVTILYPPDRLDEMPRLRGKLKQGEPVAQYETIRVRKDGVQLNVALTLSPIRDATGKITDVATIARDITERKRAESELQRLQQLAAARERTRLARDLHDNVLQSLAVAGLNLEAAIQGLKADPEVAKEQMRGVQDLIVREQRKLRSFIEELKPATLVPGEMDFKFGYLLQQLAKTVEQQWHLRVELRMDGLDGQLPAVLAREIYQIIREGLINAARHSHASVVQVDLQADDHNARVSVSDNGFGFSFHGHYSDAALTSTGLGPVVIKSRVASLGGLLNIDSSASGARLEVILPLSVPRA
jgi:PAS domain S-box-containing protein